LTVTQPPAGEVVEAVEVAELAPAQEEVEVEV
jgi:hypothetical protein